MTSLRPLALILLCLAAAALLLGSPAVSSAESARAKLRKEKARLTEMRKRAEKAAGELDETLRREKAARHKVDDTQKRLTHQRRLIARIDRKLSLLAREMEEAESEVRAIEEEREHTQAGLSRAATMAFLDARDAAGLLPVEVREERLRYFTGRVLASEAGRYVRLTADKEDKEIALSGIERQVRLSEKRISREKIVGESLLTQRKKEAERLAGIKAQKEKKEKELRALRARLARMESLVSRIERQMREEERKRARGKGPSKFSGVPGGLVAPVMGRVVGRFGKVRDPVFDVDVENHGVEIETSSGAPIRSIGKGTVVFSGTVSGFGKVLIIQHGSGLFSVYGKAESFTAAQGQVVAPGQNIGRLPENPDGKSMLYLELRAGGTAIDPSTVIPLSR